MKKRTSVSKKKPQEGSRSQKQRVDVTLLKTGLAIDGILAAPPSGTSILITGSFKEGGGQILRNASALGAITQQQIYVEDIRASNCFSLKLHPLC